MKEEKVISKSQGTATEDNIIEFPITNDIVFNLVMQDPDISRHLLERIFPDKQIGEIRVVDGDGDQPNENGANIFDLTTQYVIENGISVYLNVVDIIMQLLTRQCYIRELPSISLSLRMLFLSVHLTPSEKTCLFISSTCAVQIN
ncbi:hypothetical protein EV211_1553 [Aminicella lysinilytica]|uniref:Uncharacterized protein n=1 Tax=Aminicella lysinilytica TaxID=433323 RepID=A0A4R6PXE6_9FIRM|nr:hypothetical protein EV211_1553 [Aminicella lysinilytica]